MIRWVLGACLALMVAGGCSKKEDVIVETASDVVVTPGEIDRDPWALLPPDALTLSRVDATQFFASDFGRRMRALAEARLPLPPGAGFDPERDLKTLHVGTYSMQGADLAGVAVGHFDAAAIESAADGTTDTPLGAPLVKSQYAGRNLYTSRNVGFTILTERTALFGNETGIRRALDRLEQGKIARQLPDWMEPLLESPDAAVVLGADLEQQPTVRAALGDFVFVKGLRQARVLGNFGPPGMNFSGTLTYADSDGAAEAAKSLTAINQTLRSYSFFMQLAGIGNPVHHLDVKSVGAAAEFVVAIQGSTIEWVLNQLANQLGATPKTIQATESPAVEGERAVPR